MKYILTAMITALLFSGCAKAPEESRSGILPVMHGKKAAPFRVDYQAPRTAAAGETVTVAITLTALQDAINVSLITEAKGMDLLSGEPFISRSSLNAGEILSAVFTARVKEEGIVFINSLAKGTFGKKELPCIIKIPIRVGGNPEQYLKKSGPVETDHSGQKIIKMKAVEK